MRYRLAALGLAAVLGLLAGLTTMPAAPAPDRPVAPPIYALVYVGLGKNDPDNAKRIAVALQELRGYGARAAVRDPKVEALSIVQEQEKKLGWIERDKWAANKTHTANLEGTAVVRVWFADGSPQEQVVIVNAIARTYVENQQEMPRNRLKDLERYQAMLKQEREAAGVKVTEEDERVFGRQLEAIRHLPYVIEWASLPEKP